MTYVCPTCHQASQHPMDEAEGYCGNCHAFTGRHFGSQVPTIGEIRAPRCPLCDLIPIFTFGYQYFCGNDACPAFCWNPTKDPADFRANMKVIDLNPPGGVRDE
jgi:hypothetical protein